MADIRKEKLNGDDQIIRKGKEVLAIEGNAVLGLVDKVNGDFARAVKSIGKSRGRVVFTGMGKSGLIARKIVATLNSTGTGSIFLHPTDAFHGDLGMVRKDDIVIILSKSGATQELLDLIPMIRRLGVLVIGFLGKMISPLAELCDIVLDVSVPEEACPHDLAPTASTTAALAMGDALAVALIQIKGFTAEDFALLHPGGSLGKRLSLKISEIMYKGEFFPKVNLNAPLNEVIYEITSKRLGTTSVLNDDGSLCGIITDGDLRRALEKYQDIRNLRAENIMSPNPKTISQEFLASFALTQMEAHSITSLIVSDESGKPVGLVHLHDLVKLGLQKR